MSAVTDHEGDHSVVDPNASSVHNMQAQFNSDANNLHELVKHLQQLLQQAQTSIGSLVSILTAVTNAAEYLKGQGHRIPSEVQTTLASIAIQVEAMAYNHSSSLNALQIDASSPINKQESAQSAFDLNVLAKAYTDLTADESNIELREALYRQILIAYIQAAAQTPPDAAREQIFTALNSIHTKTDTATNIDAETFQVMLQAVAAGMEHLKVCVVDNYGTEVPELSETQRSLKDHLISGGSNHVQISHPALTEAIEITNSKQAELREEISEILHALQAIRDLLLTQMSTPNTDADIDARLQSMIVEFCITEWQTFDTTNEQNAQNLILEQVLAAYCEALSSNGDMLTAFLEHFETEEARGYLTTWTRQPQLQQANSDTRLNIFKEFAQLMHTNPDIQARDALDKAFIAAAMTHLATIKAINEVPRGAVAYGFGLHCDTQNAGRKKDEEQHQQLMLDLQDVGREQIKKARKPE